MQDLKQREFKMQEKRKNSSFRDFLKEICSWYSLVFYSNNGLISRFPKTKKISIIKKNIFSEKRDKLNYINYDTDKNLFENINNLFQEIDLPNLFTRGNNENTSYADIIINSKNAYLSYSIQESENVLYTYLTRNNCKNIFNSTFVINNSENIYQSVGILNSNKIFYSNFISNSFDIRFSDNLINCQNCIFCSNLENKSYYINNKEYNKEEYQIKKAEILKNKNSFLQNYKNISFDGKNIGSTNISGNFLFQCENIENGYFCNNLSNSRNTITIGGEKNENIFDMFMGGATTNNDLYGVCGCGLGSQNIFNSAHVSGSNIYYSYFLESCSYCLGCVGLKNKQFCILNKQYTKEERYELADKIFQQMDSDGTLGEFFPGSMNPFYFNDTAAYLIDDSFTKEEVTAQGYLRRDDEIKVDIPVGAEIVKTTELEDFQGYNEKGERTINPEILKKVIVDEKGNSYRIVKMEYDFLMKHGLPLPEIHWLDRIKLGFKFK